jgi:hypothetical protein
MPALIFYGGVGEIGGNKILLEDQDTRIFLDFGQSFTFGEDYFVEWLRPRSINGLGDYFEFDLLPDVCGLYSEKQLEGPHIDYCMPISTTWPTSLSLMKRFQFIWEKQLLNSSKPKKPLVSLITVIITTKPFAPVTREKLAP